MLFFCTVELFDLCCCIILKAKVDNILEVDIFTISSLAGHHSVRVKIKM